MKNFVKRHKLFLACIGILLFIYTILLPIRQHYRTQQSIISGDLHYYPEIGWVDMGHADPSGPIKMVQAIDKHRGGTLTYYQDMRKSFLGLTIGVRMTNRYSIPKELGRKRDGILRYVFEDVSKDFEALQATHPLKSFCGKGMGDINGDRIALLRSMHMRTPRCLNNPANKKVALEKLQTGTLPLAVSSDLAKYLPSKVPVHKFDSKISLIFEFKKSTH